MRQAARYTVERSLQHQGSLLVCGIDEVGRGALAGPLVSAAVVLPPRCRLELFDSKHLSPTQRAQLATTITATALGVGIGWVKNTEIDSYGLAWALQTSYERALEDLASEVSCIILDGNHNYLADYEICQTHIKADQEVACVAAASIMAKVARDQYMHTQAHLFPQYGFATNVGYGSAAHLQGIAQHGTSSLHRHSFRLKKPALASSN